MTKAVSKEEILHFDDLSIDLTRKKAFIGNDPVILTKKEFEMLVLLVSHPGRVFSREDILTSVWSDDVFVLDRSIDVNITRLRKKLGDYGNHIVTRLGYGYCFDYN
jgi:DNA-binding response OmpR family regulator